MSATLIHTEISAGGAITPVSPANPVPVQLVGAGVLPTGAATAAKQPALGTAGAPSADVLSVQGVAYTFSTAAVQTITAGAAAQTVFAANTARVYLFVLNTSDTVMYLDVTGAAATSAAIPLAPNGGFYEPSIAPGGAISLLCATTGKTFVAKQA